MLQVTTVVPRPPGAEVQPGSLVTVWPELRVSLRTTPVAGAVPVLEYVSV